MDAPAVTNTHRAGAEFGRRDRAAAVNAAIHGSSCEAHRRDALVSGVVRSAIYRAAREAIRRRSRRRSHRV